MVTSLRHKMRKSSENHVDYGILSEHFSPGSKVRDFYFPNHNPAFALETPMKPSQIPNRFPHQTYSRSLHCHRPEQQQRHRQPFSMTPYYPPPQSAGPHHHRLGQLQHGYTSPNWSNGENYNRPQLCPRAQVSHHWRPVTPTLLPLPPPRVSVSHVNQTSIHAMLPQRDPPDSSTDAGVKRQDLTGQDKPKDKVESGPVEDVPLVELHKPSGHPLLSGCHKDRAPRPHQESWSSSSGLALPSMPGQDRRSSLPFLHSHMPTQEQHQEETASRTSQTKARQKRCRRSRSDDVHAKKPCLPSVQPDTTLQCPSANVPTSHSQLPDSESSPKTSENHTQKTESLQEKPLKSTHSLPHTPKSWVKQASVHFSNNGVIVLTPTWMKSDTKIHEESKKTGTTATITTPSNSTNVSFSSRNEPKSLHSISQVADSKMVDLNCNKAAVKANAGSPSCRKVNRPKKPPVLDDISDLFTPDPVYTVNSVQKTLKIRPDDKAKILNDKSEQAVSNHAQTPGSKLLHKEKASAHGNSSTNVSNTNLLIPDDVQISLPTVILTRMALPEKDANACETVKHREDKKKAVHDDCLDLDLDLTLDLDLDAPSTQSSDSEEPLVSLQEIMTRKSKPLDTPNKGAFSTPSTPSTPSHTNHKRLHHTLSNTRTGNYKNSLDQILKEITTSKKAKETETELLTACQEDLLRIAEFEEDEMNKEGPLSAEHQQILQRYSLLSSAIREVPPGHDLFQLEKFGRIFNQNTLQLRQCILSPQETAQKTLLWSSHAQFKLYVHIDLFQEAYQRSPCPFQITRFLFKMMCVHNDHLLSVKILQILTDIAYTAATQTVNGSDRFRVWVPSVADVTLVLMNMGVPFVSLFPLETLQPPFTEGELLEDIYIKSESPSNQAPSTFPEHNCNNMFKYLSCCLGLCPQAYSDSELLLLLTTLCTVSLETRFLLQATVDLYPLFYKLLNNIRHWDDMMLKICLALTGLTDDHHNMCYLVQLLPDHTRGKTLRRHLSLSMISKLLDGSCMYRPKSKELQLSDLRLYVWKMKPSSLLRSILSSCHRSQTEGEEDRNLLDQQAYYLCYSLLTLTNEATNVQFFPPQQKKHLLLLCSELERHVKCHIRESEKCLYRSKVKDLVARIYTKWQMLLQKTRPLNGKLYDYWQPLQGDSGGSLDIEEIESSQEVTEKDSVLDQDTVEMVEDGTKMDDKVVDLTEKELTQNGLTNAAQKPVDEHLKEETEIQDEGMDYQDGEGDQFPEEGSVIEKANSTFVLDTEGGDTLTQGDELCENMDTETEHTSGLSPEQSLSPGFECGVMERHAVAGDRTDTALLPLLQTS
ncbi:SMC5-SMC6 complex localization factor protein 2 [Periophthalmus magnuspinnatus]|uniref:SMC5-SMC6 complex localization factor protein 2 n=1 Tax=Periophthalmus magnuspinnatus TaxID=409849 RepID=UPI00145B0FEE|nr:SMC5-SMC6 complex localization factor protein 2 [Periophthalmus magnuspinnatus]